MKNLVKKMCILLVLLSSLSGYGEKVASTGGGNGGDGLLKEKTGKIKLLDLVAHGISDSPYLHDHQNEDPDVKKNVIKLLSRNSEVSNEVKTCLVRTLSWYKQSYLYLYEIVKRNWSKRTKFIFINEPLVVGKDVNTDLYTGKLVRIASRNDWRLIKVYREAYNKLEENHRCPFFAHELVYSGLEDKTSLRTRKVIGFTFDETYKDATREDHEELLLRLSRSKDLTFDSDNDLETLLTFFKENWLKWGKREISGTELLLKSTQRIPINDKDLEFLKSNHFTYITYHSPANVFKKDLPHIVKFKATTKGETGDILTILGPS